MRAVKTVISAAGNLKRENPEMSEVKFDLAQLEFLNFFFQLFALPRCSLKQLMLNRSYFDRVVLLLSPSRNLLYCVPYEM